MWLRWLRGKPQRGRGLLELTEGPTVSRCLAVPEERKQPRRLPPEVVLPEQVWIGRKPSRQWTSSCQLQAGQNKCALSASEIGFRGPMHHAKTEYSHQGASSSPFSQCLGPLAAFLLAAQQVQKGRGIKLPLFPYLSSLAPEGQWLQSLSSLVGWSPTARSQRSESSWPCHSLVFLLHLPWLGGSEAAGIPICLVFGWLFISGGRIGSHESTARP